jgi:molybdopterin-guanine dinucleotide biosynthesis protein A
VLIALAEAADSCLVVANDPRAPGWFPGHRMVADAEPGLGPLAGIVTALRAARGAAVLLVAWDMPFVPGALLQALRERGEVARASNVPVHGIDDHAESLCPYYHPDALPVAEALLARGERRARALYEALVEQGGAVTMGARGLERFGDPARLFLSVDTSVVLDALGGSAPEPD